MSHHDFVHKEHFTYRVFQVFDDQARPGTELGMS